MKTIPLYQIDAFSDVVFKGNPAAVCVLDEWLDDAVMHQIAEENNLSETAFIVPKSVEPKGSDPSEIVWEIRWFTPSLEVPLCGHATLAAAYVLFNELACTASLIHFHSKSGVLMVSQTGGRLTLDFPAMQPIPCDKPPEALVEGLGGQPIDVFKVDDDPNYYVIYKNEQEVLDLKPDLPALATLHPYGVVISAEAATSDCVSRYFLPSYNIPEDPVTGSIHCALVPYWAGKLNKQTINAAQASKRGGELCCEHRGDRVLISGRAVKYLEGKIFI